MTVKNADMPAMPQSFAMTEQEWGTTVSHMGNDELPMNIGLTKREMFAMHAMQAILANGASEEIGYTDWGVNLAKHAITAADALLEELSK